MVLATLETLILVVYEPSKSPKIVGDLLRSVLFIMGGHLNMDFVQTLVASIFNTNPISIWVTFPRLHIDKKLVTFGWSLNHFYDQIQNGTIKTRKFFLDDFSARVRICNHFL